MIPRRKVHITSGDFDKIVEFLFSKDSQHSQYIAEWEERFAQFIGAKYAISVNSGRKGMELILKSLGLKKGDEVIFPAYTLKDLIGIVQSLGATAILADIDPRTFNIDPDSVIKKITDKTKVIVATHIFGLPCRIDRVLEIAKNNAIFVVEDCAHSTGSEIKGRKTGSFGDAAFFSFETTKLINTYGGGMIVTNDGKKAEEIRSLATSPERKMKLPIRKMVMAHLENCFLPTSLSLPALYLLASPFWHQKIYALYRKTQSISASAGSFTWLQASIGLQKLKTLEERIYHRRGQALLLKSLLVNRINSQHIDEGVLPNYYFFVALFPCDILQLRRFLLRHGIDAGIGAEIADDCCGPLGLKDCLNTAEVFQHAMQIPLHEGVSEPDIRYMAEILNKFFS